MVEDSLAALLLGWDWIRGVGPHIQFHGTTGNHCARDSFESLHMKYITLMSALSCGLSIFLVTAQAQNDMPTAGSGAATAGSTQPSTAQAEQKPDINEVIQTSTEFTNSVGMVMKKVGSLWISAYETTQESYQEVTGSNPSAFAGEERPVDSVSWDSAVAFCEKLTEHEKQAEMLPNGYRYSLPTQEQWQSLASGVPLSDAVTSLNGSRSGTVNVGTLAPSAAGLYDLRGNVSEWSADPADGAFRVLRGGNWKDWIDINLRLDFRIYEAPQVAQNTFGFRCVLIKGN